jgi:CHAT domain-containing protein
MSAQQEFHLLTMRIHPLTYGRLTRFVLTKLCILLLSMHVYSSLAQFDLRQPTQSLNAEPYDKIFPNPEWSSDSIRRSIEDYIKLQTSSRSSKRWRDAASASLHIAELHFNLGDYRQSLIDSLSAASDFRRAGDRLGLSRALSRAGQVSSLLGDNEGSRTLTRRALEFYSPYGDQPPTTLKQPIGEALANAGEVYYSTGDLFTASDYFKRSLDNAIESGDRDCETRVRLFIGYVSATRGDMQEARHEFDLSRKLARATFNPRSEALALAAIATAESWQRNNERALKLQRNAMAIFRFIGDRQNEAVSHVGIGQAYLYLNETKAALVHYQEALRVFQENGNQDHAVIALYQLAKAYQAENNIPQAITFYTRCLSLSRVARKQRVMAYALNDLVALQKSQAHRKELVAECRKALRFYNRIGDRQGQALTLNLIGDLSQAAKDRSKALRFYQQALPLSMRVGDRGVEIATLYKIASVQKESGDLTEALTTIQGAIEIVERVRSSVASLDFRSSYFSTQRKYYELYIDLLMQLDQQQPGKGYAAEALLASENSRARSLRESLEENRAGFKEGIKPELLDRERNLRSLLRASAEYHKDETDLLRAEYEEVQAQIREQNPRLKAFTNPKGVSLDEIKSQLRDKNTMFIEYSLGDERSYVWSITKDSTTGYVLPGRESIERTAKELYESLIARQAIDPQVVDNYEARVDDADKNYVERASELSRVLLGPVAHELGHRRLIIVSEGMLQYVPFDALPEPDSSSLLISNHEVVNLPSISVLAALRANKPPSTSSKGTIAIFADPIFSSSDERVTQRVATSESSLLRLTNTSDETDAIAHTVSSARIAKGFAANLQSLLSSDLTQYRILHFATHGVIDRDHPEFSGLVLSTTRRDGAADDGYLQLEDIYNLNISADLTVLSACDTALGKDLEGEGVVSLTRGFIYAGSRSVVASLWKVDDRATAALMKYFYWKMLHDGLSPAAALRDAKDYVRKQPGWSAPYYWAGFTIQGEYLEPIPNEQSLTAPIVLSVFFTVLVTCPLLRKKIAQKHA